MSGRCPPAKGHHCDKTAPCPQRTLKPRLPATVFVVRSVLCPFIMPNASFGRESIKKMIVYTRKHTHTNIYIYILILHAYI